MVNPLTTLPEGWVPEPKVRLSLAQQYGREVDLNLILAKFRAYYTEGQTSREWDSRFVVWVIREVQQIREKKKGGSDDLGNPLTQRPATTAGLTPEDEGYVSLDDLAADARRIAEEQADG
jgi:hypothetical protein